MYFFDITRFDLYSVFVILLFYGVKSWKTLGKATGKIHFSCLRVRSASLTDMRMRICYENMAVGIFRKRENSKLWRDCFPNCAPVSLGEQRILIK